MKLKPLQDWAIIERIEPEEKTAAGIIIPDSAKEKPTEGIVLAIGPGKFETEKGEKREKEKKKKFVHTVLKPGQRIIYGKYSAREFDFDRETIILVRESDVLGIVEDTRLAQKKPFEVAKRQHSPVMIKEKSEVMTVPAAPHKVKTSEKKRLKKEKVVSKIVEKKEKKKSGSGETIKKTTTKTLKKVAAKKKAEKKSPTKKASPKPPKKSSTVKKVKPAEKKIAVKKTVQKKTVLPKKKAVSKKTAPKPAKKTAVKKTTIAKKPVAKGRAKR